MSDDSGNGDDSNAPANSVAMMKLRPRRSVLTDISNKVISVGSNIADATKKAVTSKKRKTSTGGIEIESKKRSSVAESQVESDAKIKSDASSSSSSSSALASSVIPVAVPFASIVVTSSSNAKASQKTRRTIPLYTKGSDPAQCLDIIDDMYDIYLDNEEKYAAKNYMTTKQTDINFKMRSILIDWLVEVHHKFKLFPSTLWLCVNILDRYLEKISIMRSKLQLVGVTALFIACKFEEIYPPEVNDCVYITDYAYDREEVLKMETTILVELNWEILVPTGYHFLTRYLNCIRCSERTRNVAFYYAERNLQEQELLSTTPHRFAAAAVYAALKQQNTQYFPLRDVSAWPQVLREESGLEEADIISCASTIVKHVSEEPVTTSKRKLVATKKKYQSEKYDNTSNLVLPSF